MYQAIFALGYYGLMRISELVLTESNHAVRAKDVKIGLNKDKILLVLYTSKTHGKHNEPQKIKITGTINGTDFGIKRFFCPFTIVRRYAALRGDFEEPQEPFVVFGEGSQLTVQHMRMVLRELLCQMNLDSLLYDTHSLRIGD